ncbi:MAG: CapA family protein, partial [Clostridia bacterium]|nr:CapA family protein [Clostridia bacterium]
TINPTVLEDIAYAETIADVVIVCPHWGTEYVSKPSSYQGKFAEQMTEAGADLIIGTHRQFNTQVV